ncbi:Syntaxin-41 [Tritrichomonas foetus]|uniref:Syntaxin-41 n=1 Tax=Tritrichomonas foetus TaxID=1144522 RepID=A0A1J4K3W1_9EUKA|nr:Syntaxin-41 [Tritrichomonas foetus]|eukprot:OHT06137.1 Syntaxin-41 [Tritrichomonas foetus]
MHNSGFKNNYTDLFISFRNQHHSSIPERSKYSDNLITTLSDNINVKLSLLNRKIEELDELFTQRMMPTFDNAVIELCDHNIRQTTSDISRRINNLSLEIKCPISTHDSEIASVLVNLQQCHRLQLSKMVQKFRNLQATKRPNMHTIVDNQGDLISDIYADFSPNESHDSISLIQQNLETRQNEDLEQLVSMMNELNSLFRDVSLLIFEQGTVLDRIDTKIEMAIQDVQRGNEQLEQANEYQAHDCFYTYITVLLVLIGICLMIMIFRVW